MKAAELRIGNKVDLYGSIATVGRFDFNDRPPNGLAVDKGKPIPLTEEWLVKYAFDAFITNGIAWWEHNDLPTFRIIWHENGFYLDMEGWAVGVEIKYVHQLQNLYFSLTEKELQIKQS